MMLYHSNMPQIDLHGEDRIGARIKVKSFINDNYKLDNSEFAIIHGIGGGILKREVFDVLKKDKRVLEFGIDCFNAGCTLVKIKTNVDKNGKKCYNTAHNLGGNYNVYR